MGGIYTAPTGAAQADLSSSRAIDPKRRTYLVDDDGGFSFYDDVYQRVVMLLDYGFKLPPLKGNDFERQTETSIRRALSPLTSGPTPEIRIKQVVITSSGGNEYVQVEFFKFKSNSYQVLKLTA